MVNELTVLTSIHVIAAAFWVGGGFVLNIAMFLAARSGDKGNMLSAMRLTSFFGRMVMPLLALTVLITGVWITEDYYSWDLLWIQLGLAGVVITTAVGMLYLGPRAAKGIAGMEAGRPPPPGRNWVPIVARLNFLIITTVLVLMVIKPT
jgi:putative copper export protein